MAAPPHPSSVSLSGIGGSSIHEIAAKQVVLITTVDIGGGRSDTIVVHVGDEPAHVAAAFVAKHGLPAAIAGPLEQHIQDNLAAQQAKPVLRPGSAPGGRVGQAGRLEASASVASSSCGSTKDGVAIYSRLYEQAIQQREKLEVRKAERDVQEAAALAAQRVSMSWISSEMMRDRTSGPYDNYGEMLYAESLEALARRHERAEQHKAARAAAEVQGATFHPEISALARTLWDGEGPKAWQRLVNCNRRSKTEERLDMLRRERENAEVAECTFKPVLNKRSDALMSERVETLRSLHLSAHDQLYQDALHRNLKQDENAHWFPEEVTFAPKLYDSSTSRELLRRSWGRITGSSASTAPPLVERLYASHDKLHRKLEDARRQLEGPLDPQTGRRLFHPETGRPPASRPAGLAVSDYLYSLQAEGAQRAAMVAAQSERERSAAAASSKVSSHSAALIRKLKRKRFRQIFEFLDVAQAGQVELGVLVASPPAWLDELDDEVRADVTLAAQLHARAASPTGGAAAVASSKPAKAATAGAPGAVGLDAFCKLMEEALSRRRGPRTYLAPSPPSKAAPGDSFTPTITERSKQLAARVRPKDTPLFEVLHKDASHIKSKLEEKRVVRCEEEMRECTFAPRLVAQQLVPEGRALRAAREGLRSAGVSTDFGAIHGRSSSFGIHGSPSQPAVDLYTSELPRGEGAYDSDEERFMELEREVQDMLSASAMAAAPTEDAGPATQTSNPSPPGTSGVGELPAPSVQVWEVRSASILATADAAEQQPARSASAGEPPLAYGSSSKLACDDRGPAEAMQPALCQAAGPEAACWGDEEDAAQALLPELGDVQSVSQLTERLLLQQDELA